MSKRGDEYRRNAVELREIAASMSVPAAKLDLEKVAEFYERRADELDKESVE